MSVSSVSRFGFPALMMSSGVAMQATGVQAQQRGGTVQTDQGAAREQRRQPLSRHQGLGTL